MLEYPFVSVVVPVFNDWAGLSATLQALRQQTYPQDKFEIIVVDNGSTSPIDGELDLSGVRFLKEESKGSYAARNCGIGASRGVIIAFTDADCEPVPEWLEQGVRDLGDERDKHIVGGSVNLFVPAGKHTVAAEYAMYSNFDQQANVVDRQFIATANMLVYRSAFDSVGLFNSTLYSGGDSEWSWRAKAAGFTIVFSLEASVRHPCRTTIKGLVTQARRVAGGRLQLARLAEQGKLPVMQSHTSPPPIGHTLKVLFSDDSLSLPAKLRILFVGTVVKVNSMLEVLKLKYGAEAERQ